MRAQGVLQENSIQTFLFFRKEKKSLIKRKEMQIMNTVGA
jgi:hypothetical protein